MQSWGSNPGQPKVGKHSTRYSIALVPGSCSFISILTASFSDVTCSYEELEMM